MQDLTSYKRNAIELRDAEVSSTDSVKEASRGVIYLEIEDALEAYKLTVLKGSIMPLGLIRPEDSLLVKVRAGGTEKGIGFLKMSSLKAFVSNPVLSCIKKYVIDDTGEVLDGEMIYALCEGSLE